MTRAVRTRFGSAHARSYGAITVVNAIATGRGAAIGIDLSTDAEVRLERGRAGGSLVVDVHIEGDENEDPKLARACVEAVLERFAVSGPVHATVTTRSTIPVSRGLKSSSAAANAVTLATIGALGLSVGDDDKGHISHIDVVRLGVQAALAAGVTITGAFDDACACYFGGLVATDNTNRSVMHEERLDDLEVILVVPPKKVRTFDTSTAPTHPIRGLVAEAHALVLDGAWRDAMLRNSLAYGGAYGMSNRLVLSMLDTGAIAAGISGTGPAQAVVIRRDDWDCFTDIIADASPEARVLVAHVNHERAILSEDPLPPAPSVRVVHEGGSA